jgi:hypothetical protein
LSVDHKGLAAAVSKCLESADQTELAPLWSGERAHSEHVMWTGVDARPLAFTAVAVNEGHEVAWRLAAMHGRFHRQVLSVVKHRYDASNNSYFKLAFPDRSH